MGKRDVSIVRLAAGHVFELFRKVNPDNPLVFHNFGRSRALVDASREIAKGSKLDDEELEVVLLAAWFHDTGYAAARDGGQKKSIELARSFLADERQPQQLADAVAACIEAARAPLQDNPMHEVLHDALLLPMVSKNYLAEAEQIRLERQRRNGERYSDVEWSQTCIEFFDSNQFRTRYAQLQYNDRRAANLVGLHKLLHKQLDEAAERQAQEAKVSKGVSKTIEDIFSSTTRKHLQIHAIADRRTSTMIHVNAIMVSLVVGLLLRDLESHRYLLIPTLLLLTANLITIFVCIYSMRLARGKLRRVLGADATVHDQNLLSFTNDTALPIQEYTARMDRLAADAPALKQAMMEDLYFGRKLLHLRAKALAISYDVFIIGLAISLVAFAVALIRS
jgi:hypothetical protein